MYGDYNYNKSTLDKYKNNEKTASKGPSITPPSIIPDITGGASITNPV